MGDAPRYGDLTSEELAARAATAIVVVPLGAMEQHGPHLPLDTDWRLCATVAERACALAASRDVHALVTPPVWVGYSPHHMDFPGTVTLEFDVFVGVVRSVARSLWRHGVRKIMFLNGHGGNANLLRAALQELRFADGVRAVGASYWDFAADLIPNWRRSRPGGINHACEMETSLMLAVRPDAVRQERVRDATWFPASPYLSEDLTVSAPVTVNWSHAELDASGVLGDPTVASADRGAELLDRVVEQVALFLADFARWDWYDPRAT